MYASSGKGTNLSAQEAGLSARLSLDSSRLAAKITFFFVPRKVPEFNALCDSTRKAPLQNSLQLSIRKQTGYKLPCAQTSEAQLVAAAGASYRADCC
jgi:hypothetical protein